MRSPRTMLAAALCSVLLSAGARAEQGLAEVRMPLKDAVEHALRKNQDLVVQRELLLSADVAVTGAHGAYDPQVEVGGTWEQASPPVNSAFSGAPDGRLSPTNTSLSADASVRQLLKTGGEITLRASASRETTDGTFTLLSPAYGTDLGIELRQPLLRGRSLDAARLSLKVAAAERTRQAASLRREVSETVAAVERGYWTLVAAREQVGVGEEAVRLAEEQLRETLIRIEKGASPETEAAQPRAEIERRRGEMLASREAVSRAESTLKRLILGDADADLWSRTVVPSDDPAVEPVEVDVASAMERALTLRPELDAAVATEERRKSETRFARSGVLPSLDAVASYDRLGFAGSLNPNGASIPGVPVIVPPRIEGGLWRSYATLGNGDFTDARVGVVLSLPVGNRAAIAAARSAESAERQAAAELASARNVVRAEVLDAAAGLRTADQRLEAARAERQAAEIQLGAERDRFAAGLSTNFLVLTRQNDLARARLDEISARTDCRTARTEWSRSTGELLKERGIEVQGAARDPGMH